MTKKTRVCVVGLGYIGLPSAATLAKHGFEVLGVDINAELVDSVNRCRLQLAEPGLQELVEQMVTAGTLRASSAPEPAEVFLIAVQTPLGPPATMAANRLPDLTAVRSAVESVAPHLLPGSLLIVESTCPVGTTEAAREWLEPLRSDLKFPGHGRESPGESVLLAYCPERVLPGQSLAELLDNDRVVGGLDRESGHAAADFYKSFVRGEVLTTDTRTAEMCKLAENSFRAVNIAFANELSMIAESYGVDVWELIRLANQHPRVEILGPGAGVGGHCIPVDPQFLCASAPNDTQLIATALAVNEGKKVWALGRILQAAAEFEQPVVACLGAAYKSNSDDLRESPALEIVVQLARSGRCKEVLLVEPNLNQLPPALEGSGVRLVALDQALSRAHVIAALVSHREFETVDVQSLGRATLVDVCGLKDRSSALDHD